MLDQRTLVDVLQHQEAYGTRRGRQKDEHIHKRLVVADQQRSALSWNFLASPDFYVVNRVAQGPEKQADEPVGQPDQEIAAAQDQNGQNDKNGRMNMAHGINKLYSGNRRNIKVEPFSRGEPRSEILSVLCEGPLQGVVAKEGLAPRPFDAQILI